MTENAMPGQEEVILDFSGVKPYEPLEEGKWYLVQISKFEVGRAAPARGGGPKISAEFTVTVPEQYEGRKLFREFSLQPQALPFLHQLLHVVAPEEELGEDFILKPSDYIGAELAVRIKNEEFEEQIRSRIARMAPASAYVKA